LFILSNIFQFPQFQPTNAYNCHVIYNSIFKNIELLHVLDLTGPSSEETLVDVAQSSY